MHKMTKADLESKKIYKQVMLKKLKYEIHKLDKQIEAIENGPVSAEEWVNNHWKSPCAEGVLEYSDLATAFEAGEQNDRKRTQPLIDAAKNGLHNKFGWWEEVEEALKTLEENEH